MEADFQSGDDTRSPRFAIFFDFPQLCCSEPAACYQCFGKTRHFGKEGVDLPHRQLGDTSGLPCFHLIERAFPRRSGFC